MSEKLSKKKKKQREKEMYAGRCINTYIVTYIDLWREIEEV